MSHARGGASEDSCGPVQLGRSVSCAGAWSYSPRIEQPHAHVAAGRCDSADRPFLCGISPAAYTAPHSLSLASVAGYVNLSLDADDSADGLAVEPASLSLTRVLAPRALPGPALRRAGVSFHEAAEAAAQRYALAVIARMDARARA